MNEYLLGASKLLALYGYNCHKRDEDAISFVATCMMQADETWDGKSSSRDTWRFNQAKFAIMKLKTRHRKQRKFVSLNKVVHTAEDGRKVFLQDFIEDKKSYPANNIVDIMAQAEKYLSPQQFECLQLYYYDNMTMQDIGDKIGITKAMVSLHIKRAVQILKNESKFKSNYITS
jgi:RNA polymerase sigma factor (sigma-70 family)